MLNNRIITLLDPAIVVFIILPSILSYFEILWFKINLKKQNVAFMTIMVNVTIMVYQLILDNYLGLSEFIYLGNLRMLIRISLSAIIAFIFIIIVNRLKKELSISKTEMFMMSIVMGINYEIAKYIIGLSSLLYNIIRS